MTRYHPVTVTVPGEGAFEIHMGAPGKPRIYRKADGGALRRVKNDDPVLVDVATAFREGVDKHKAVADKEDKRRRGRVARFFRWVGGWLARVWYSLLPKK